MKQFFSALGLAAALLITSCAKDLTEDNILNNTDSNGVAKHTITVGIDNNQTRIHLGEEEDNYMPLYWSEGDQLSVHFGSLSKPLHSDELTADSSGSNTTNFTFTSNSELSGWMKAIYPADIWTSAAHFYIKSEQPYNPDKLANGYAIMIGYAKTESDKISMKHMCGYFKVSLTGDAIIKRVSLRTIAHEPISGYFKPSFPAETDTEPKPVSMDDYEAIDIADGFYTSPIISINCGEGVALSGEATDFYFAIPAGNYEKGFALTIVDNNNKQQIVAAYKGSKTIEAGVLTKMPALAVNCTQEVGIYDANQFVGFGRSVSKDYWTDANNQVRIYADIDLQNENLEHLSRGLVSFRGDDFATYHNNSITLIEGAKSDNSPVVISNASITSTASAALLFHNIPPQMTIRNFQLGTVADDPATPSNEADCILTVNASSSWAYLGILSNHVYGKVENCTNYASLHVTETGGNGTLAGAFNGGYSAATGSITNCKNYGMITVVDAGCTSYNIVGGIVGRAYGVVDNCENYGSINVSGSKVNNYIGGIVGQSYSVDAVINNCTNRGKVVFHSATDSGKASHIGGVIGSAANGTLSHTLTNYGEVNIHHINVLYCGGVIGYAWEACVYDSSLEAINEETGKMYVYGASNIQCGGVLSATQSAITLSVPFTNKADIVVSGKFSETKKSANRTYIGGVLGQVTKASALSNMNNSGDITVSDIDCPGSWSYIGGVFGSGSSSSSNTFTNCHSKDCSIFVNSDIKVRIGGIAGYGNHFTNCSAKSVTISTSKLAASSCISGIAGYNAADRTYSNTTADFSITDTSTNTVYAAGLTCGNIQIKDGAKIKITATVPTTVAIGAVLSDSLNSNPVLKTYAWENVTIHSDSSINNSAVNATTVAAGSVSLAKGMTYNTGSNVTYATF